MIIEAQKNDVVLPSGRVVQHTLLPNGALSVKPTSGDEELTNDEWNDYCVMMVKASREQLTT